jgi:hypothetical protein
MGEKCTANEIELYVAKHYNPRVNLIVPNVSWGLGLSYECDLLIVRPSGYAIEIEIKVDKYDLRNDKNKRKWMLRGNNKTIKQTYFAVPKYLEDEINNIPEGCGFMTVDHNSYNYYCGAVKILKSAKINKNVEKLSEKRIKKLGHLSAMRVWSLKDHIVKSKNY